jgi:REP element-mobilizing transposase RayT
MPQSFASLHCHLIFSTKHRAPSISAELQPRLFAYCGGTLRDAGTALVAAGGMPDHVHLLVSLGREVSLAEALRLVKANSSRWVHETFPELSGFAWQNGYGAFAVSYSLVDRVRAYIANQAEHHRKLTFQEEFVAFLKRHGIAYDERYVWE